MALKAAILTPTAYLSGTATVVYTTATPVTGGSAPVTTIVKQIMLCNTESSTTRTVTMHLYNTTSPTNAQLILSGLSLAAGETKIINLSLPLRSGAAGGQERLYAFASAANSVTITISGIEETS